nr:type II secretion system minor pseudopilin GspH [Klebsiella pneumoniae subsp. pneumoniae]
MMLVLLLIGVSASMVLLAFPSARTQEATQILARFQAQLDFVRERGQQTGQLFGIIIHPERWQFMRLQPADDSAPAAADDRWGNAQWLPLQAGRVATAETSRGQADAALSRRPAWTPGEQPDVLIFPAVKSRRFSCGLTPRWASTSTPVATASRWRRGSSHEA